MTDPLAGKAGYVVDLVAGLSDEELDQYEEFWRAQHDRFALKGDGVSAWWSTKHTSIAGAERKRRTEGINK